MPDVCGYIANKLLGSESYHYLSLARYQELAAGYQHPSSIISARNYLRSILEIKVEHKHQFADRVPLVQCVQFQPSQTVTTDW